MEEKPKIALIGYGSMGKMLESLAKDNGYIITDIFEINQPINSTRNYDFDVALDFSFPNSVVENIKVLCELNKNVVVGTTGWDSKFNEVKELVENSGNGLIYGSNFSIGMQLFFNIINNISKVLNNVDGYDIFLSEIHHKRKKDSPSGTALSLGKIVLENYNKKTTIQTETLHQAIKSEELHITSTRGGEVFGTHTVYLDSIADTIEITHRARNRIGLALGALEAAKFIHNKKGFYNFQEVIKEMINA
jgi:4-hydroxy-tetrahydrodipicolinate reductase